MSGDAERLAEWLGAQVESHNVTDITDEQTTWIEVGVDDLADRILDSDWLAAHDAAIRTEALRDAANAADGFASGVREDTGDWLRTRASDLARVIPPGSGGQA